MSPQIANISYKKWEGGAGVSPDPKGRGLFCAESACWMRVRVCFHFDELPTPQGLNATLPLAFSLVGNSSVPQTPRFKTVDEERMNGIIMFQVYQARKQET